jgi:hypothetical protein
MSNTSSAIPCVGDLGTPVFVRLFDEGGDPIDTTQATSITASVLRPSGREEEVTLQQSSDPARLATSGWAVYQTSVTGPSWFDEPGKWRVRPRVEIDTVGAWRAAKWAEFKVAP